MRRCSGRILSICGVGKPTRRKWPEVAAAALEGEYMQYPFVEWANRLARSGRKLPRQPSKGSMCQCSSITGKPRTPTSASTVATGNNIFPRPCACTMSFASPHMHDESKYFHGDRVCRQLVLLSRRAQPVIRQTNESVDARARVLGPVASACGRCLRRYCIFWPSCGQYTRGNALRLFSKQGCALSCVKI